VRWQKLKREDTVLSMQLSSQLPCLHQFKRLLQTRSVGKLLITERTNSCRRPNQTQLYFQPTCDAQPAQGPGSVDRPSATVCSLPTTWARSPVEGASA
jgi:hypothetical protein